MGFATKNGQPSLNEPSLNERMQRGATQSSYTRKWFGTPIPCNRERRSFKKLSVESTKHAACPAMD